MDQVIHLEHKGGFREIRTYSTGWYEFLSGEKKNLIIDIDLVSNKEDMECIKSVIESRFNIRNFKFQFISFDKYLLEWVQKSRFHTERYIEAHGQVPYPIANFQEAIEIIHDLKNNIMVDKECHYIIYGNWIHEICYMLMNPDDAAIIVEESNEWNNIFDKCKALIKRNIMRLLCDTRSGMRKVIDRRNVYIKGFH